MSPTITGIAPDTTAPTNQNVSILATFADNVALASKRYKIGNGDWTDYTSGVTLTENGTVYFKAVDTAGNIAEAEYEVTWIDRENPRIIVSADNSEIETQNHVTISANATDNAGLRSVQYSLNGSNWLTYTAPMVMDFNGTVFFKAVDLAGNTATENYTVTELFEGPNAPVGVSGSVKKYNLTYSWSKYTVEKGFKVSYEVQLDGGEAITVKSNKYTLKNASVGNHTFRVRARIADKISSEYTQWSEFVSQTVSDVTAPKTGKIAIVQTGADTIRLDWTAATDNVGIDRYIVTCGNESRVLSGDILSAEFSGVAGKITATVSAVDAAGLSGKTGKKTFSMKDITSPTQVTGLRSEGVDNKKGGVLAWDAATDNVGVTQYLISIEGGKTYKSKTNSVKIAKMAAGIYQYTVVALDKAKNQSWVSEEGEFKVADVIAPKIKKLSCKVQNQTALITWNAIDESSDILRSELWIDDTRVDTTDLSSWEAAGLDLGKHSLCLNVWDAADNMTTKMASCNIKALEPESNAMGMLAAL